MADAAQTFRDLHAGPDVLILPNAWDAASAALMADAGAKAVATSSAAVAWTRGYPDGDALPVPVLLAAIADMTRVIKAPLTADVEGGYTDDATALAETIAGVIGAGAVGINFEDGTRDPDLHARKIEVARQTAARAGVDLFINARTDVYLARLAEGEEAFEMAVARAERYRDAGADGIFVPGPTDEALIGGLAEAISLPLNVMGWPGRTPPAARLQALGVRRLSSATGPFRFAYASLAKALESWISDGDASVFMAPEGVTLQDLNERFG